ncbi:hypothetical protein EZJ07_23405 (plasmid) [Klebsiella pneumoniae]|nr:hypothetical protein EZJ07_23405 [Klebsiella pneumoniae]
MKRPSLEERRAMHDLIATTPSIRRRRKRRSIRWKRSIKRWRCPAWKTQNKIYNILTPEQKKQFNANFEKHLTERNAPQVKCLHLLNNLAHESRTAGLPNNAIRRWAGRRFFYWWLLSQADAADSLR